MLLIMSEVIKISEKQDAQNTREEAAMLERYVGARKYDLNVAAALNPDDEAPQERWDAFAHGEDAVPPPNNPADNVVSMDEYRNKR